MPAKESLTLLERQVALPARRRMWFFAFCCVSASMIGAAVVVGHSLRDAHVHHPDAVASLSPIDDVASSCASTIMNAALTSEEWQAYLSDGEIAGSAHIVPSYADGKHNGFKIYAIGATSLWARVGLENGDTLQKVQGQPLGSTSQVLSAYDQLQRSGTREVHVDLLRDGCAATLDVVIADEAVDERTGDAATPHVD